MADDAAFKVSKLVKILEPIDNENVKYLEGQIDLINNEVPELKNFVIPGGHVIVSYTHLARCTLNGMKKSLELFFKVRKIHYWIIGSTLPTD